MNKYLPGRRTLLFVASLLFSLYVLAPIAWLVSSSVQTEAEITTESEAPGYRWALGADLGLVINGSIGRRDYARNGFALRLHGDILVSEATRIGVQAYLHLSAFGQQEDAGFPRALSIVDLGGAAYWHKRLWRDLHFTPLAGLSLSALSVDSLDGVSSFGTLAVRLEAAVEWRFPGGRHVVRFTPIALSLYLPAAVQLAGASADRTDLGLNSSGTTWAITLGYSYRFESAPFPTWRLE